MNEKHCNLNDPIPDFSLKATNQIESNLAKYRGRPIILFFYPKDNTPVCTAEAKAFRDHYSAFRDANTVIFGVSRDTLASHERFKARLELPFELISDTNEELCNYFDVIKVKNFFGKKVKGIERSTFLIDENGTLRNAWRKIKVHGHMEEVMTAINNLKDQ